MFVFLILAAAVGGWTVGVCMACPAISHTEVTDVIKAMKHKGPGPNKLTANELKNLPPNMTNFLTEIFNHSLSAGYFPNSYKHATMTLIPKAGTSGTAVKVHSWNVLYIPGR